MRPPPLTEGVNMDWMDNGKNMESCPVPAGDFYPALDLARFYALYRPPAELPRELVIHQLEQAIIRVRRELLIWRKQQTAATLADVEQDTVNGKGEKVLLWERAVFCETKAEILRETLTMDRRSAAENNAKSGDETEEKYREFSADCIALLMGETRIDVDTL